MSLRSVDAERLISGGVSPTELADMFGMTPKEVRTKLAHAGVDPVGNSEPARYRVRDAAPFLCEIRADSDELVAQIMKLPPAKWPANMQDAFWKAQHNKLKYEELRGDLWRTDRVRTVLAETFKVIRLTILMFVDTVAQRTELTDQQRHIIQQLGDGLLSDLNDKLKENFQNYEPTPDEHGDPVGALPNEEAEGDEEEEVDIFS